MPKDPWAVVSETPATKHGNASSADPWSAVSEAPDPFAVPRNNKEGLYQMQTPAGDLRMVPYSKVMSASKAGYKISPEDRIRYGHDKLWQLRGYKGNQMPELGMIDEMRVRKELNPDTDLPESFTEATASTETPWYKPNLPKIERKALDLLPSLGGYAGGTAAGVGGAETLLGDIPIAMAGAAAGGGAAEDARQVASEVLFPFDTRLTAKESARGIGVQAGMQGVAEGLGRGVGLALRPAAKFFGDTALASKAAGFRKLPSEAAGKPASIAEKIIKESIFTKGKMEDFRAAQNMETQASVERIANQISDFKGTTEDLGKIVKHGIEEHQKQFRVIQNKLYSDIDKAVGQKVTHVPIFAQVATKVLDASGNPVMRTVQTGTEERITDNLMPSLKGHLDANGQYVEGLKDFAAKELRLLDQEEQVFSPALLKKGRRMLQTIMKAPDNMNYEAMANARSDSLGIARKLDKAMSGKESGFAKRMAKLFDESMMDAADKSGIPDLPEKIRTANRITSEEHKRFEQALVKKIIKTKKPEAIASLLTGDIGNQEARDLFAVLPSDLHAPVQREVVLDTMRDATDPLSKTFNERTFAKSIAEIGDERGNIIFGKNWKNVKEIAAELEKVNGPLGMAGSAASLQNAGIIKGLLGGSGLFSGLAMAAAGHPLIGAGIVAGEGLSILGYAVTYRTFANMITNPEAAGQFIKAAREIIRAAPYTVPAVINETGGLEKGVDRIKAKAKELQDKINAPSPSTSGPQSSVKPLWTHIYDERSGTIVPA